jgi:hypothetical protein
MLTNEVVLELQKKRWEEMISTIDTEEDFKITKK